MKMLLFSFLNSITEYQFTLWHQMTLYFSVTEFLWSPWPLPISVQRISGRGGGVVSPLWVRLQTNSANLRVW